ncbi:MAG: DUF2807 domain-containing protein [Dehalococcoidia bacterium]
MRTIAGIVALLAASGLLLGCGGDAGVSPSGNLTTEEYDFAAFTSVHLGRAFEGTITYSEAFSIAVEVDESLFELLRVTQTEDVLVVEIDPQETFPSETTLRATITMPELLGLNLTGGAHATLEGFPPWDEFSAMLDDGSALEGEIDVTQLAVQLAGASSVRLEGRATEADLLASGASTLSLGDLVLEIAHVEVNGASYAEVNVLDQLGPVEASGDSHVRYRGAPNVTGEDTSGGSTVRPLD